MHSFAKDPLYAYDDAVAAMTAITDLVTTMMGTGEESSRIAYGVGVIFDQQLDTLGKARELVAKAVKPADTTGVRRIEPMGINMVMVTEPDGRKYMCSPALAGVDPAGVKPMRFEESPMEVRRRVIAELVSDGNATGEIAQATGVKKDAVEKVIGQLLARDGSTPGDQGDEPIQAAARG